MRTEEQIRADMEPFEMELAELRMVERTAKHTALIGKCYKFRNSSGGDKSWWLYAVVTGAGEYWPSGVSFQLCEDDWEIRIKRERTLSLSGSWEEISPAEISAAWNETVNAVHGISFAPTKSKSP